MRVATIAALLSLLTARTASSQVPTAYRPSADTLRYEAVNSYLMYFVRGSDTLGEPIMTRTRETRHLKATPTGLELWVRLEGTGPNPFRSQQTYTVAPNGRVLAVDGQPAATVQGARVDVLPRLPAHAGPLAPGVAWDDTVAIRGTPPYGPTYYQVKRTYRVLRTLDTLGTTLALIAASGEMRLRQGGWQDSAQALVWWQEVAGPVADTVHLDVGAGRVIASVAVMELVGNGGLGPRDGGVTMPSGLRSSVRLSIQR